MYFSPIKCTDLKMHSVLYCYNRYRLLHENEQMNTVKSLIKDCLVFNFWTFETVLYSSFYYIKVQIFTIFSVFYSRKFFIRMSLLYFTVYYRQTIKYLSINKKPSGIGLQNTQQLNSRQNREKKGARKAGVKRMKDFFWKKILQFHNNWNLDPPFFSLKNSGKRVPYSKKGQ